MVWYHTIPHKWTTKSHVKEVPYPINNKASVTRGRAGARFINAVPFSKKFWALEPGTIKTYSPIGVVVIFSLNILETRSTIRIIDSTIPYPTIHSRCLVFPPVVSGEAGNALEETADTSSEERSLFACCVLQYSISYHILS